jgi:hypothetical protein
MWCRPGPALVTYGSLADRLEPLYEYQQARGGKRAPRPNTEAVHKRQEAYLVLQLME